MGKEFFLGALPSYDGGYRDTASGDEVIRTTSSSVPSPMYQQYVPPVDAPSSGGASVPTDTPTDKTIDVGGGTQQKESPNVPLDENGGSSDDLGTKLKLSIPIVLIGSAILFFLLRKKK